MCNDLNDGDIVDSITLCVGVLAVVKMCLAKTTPTVPFSIGKASRFL
jgi:hypothetical protein